MSDIDDALCARCKTLLYAYAHHLPGGQTYWLDGRRLCPDCGEAIHRQCVETGLPMGLEIRRADPQIGWR